MNQGTHERSRHAIIGAVLLLAGCASLGPAQLRVGESTDAATRAMGTPTAIYERPGGGQRIEFARGPYGRETWMVDADASGHVTGWSQALTEANFAQVKNGMSRDELLLRLGSPGERHRIGWQDRDLWSWRYPTNDCLWFTASLDAAERVVDSGYGIDPRCDKGDRSADRQ